MLIEDRPQPIRSAAGLKRISGSRRPLTAAGPAPRIAPMRLRIKVLLATIAVMALGYVIVTLASVAQIMSSAREQNADTAGRIFKWSVESGDFTSPGGAERLSGMLNETQLISDWRIFKRGSADQPPGSAGPHAVAVSSAGDLYELYGNPSLGGMGIGDYVLELLPSMLLGAVLLSVVLLALLSRQVLTPVAELASASRQLASGGDPVRPGGGGRKDELGQLVRSFNRMADEVVGHRRELEERVAEATEKFRRAQEAAAIAQRLAATGKLAAGVAHEINNPLGGMINAARRLEPAVAEGGRERGYLDLINEGLKRIGRIVKQMTQFQRASPELSSVDVRRALEDALRFAEHRLKGVKVEREISEELPPVLGDRHGLEQVFLNLILNAADAVRDSDAKRITVRASASGPRLVVEVEDTGCGMSPQERDAAFDIFHTTKRAGEGSGLGLPVAHSIVESHGGELRLQSSPGRGTRAVVVLPPAGAEEGKGQ